MSNQVRLVIDTMVMKEIATAGLGDANEIAMTTYNKIVRKNHTVIVSNRLTSQYQAKMDEEGIPAEFFLCFLQNVLQANGQLKQVSDARAEKMQVRVRFPSEDLFLLKIALAANPAQFQVYILSEDRDIYTADAQLQRKHNVRALDAYTYSRAYC